MYIYNIDSVYIINVYCWVKKRMTIQTKYTISIDILYVRYIYFFDYKFTRYDDK